MSPHVSLCTAWLFLGNDLFCAESKESFYFVSFLQCSQQSISVKKIMTATKVMCVHAYYLYVNLTGASFLP